MTPGPTPEPTPETAALAAPGARVLLIGTGTHDGPDLPQVPAVPRTLAAFADRLRANCGVTDDRLRVLIDPPDARTMAAAIAEEARRAESALLLYYAGHGLLGPGDELYFAARSTGRLTPGMAAHQALSLTSVREALSLCRAPSLVVMLDCCYSARAVGPLSADTPARSPFHQLPAAQGMYLLASAEQLALAPENAKYTAFTGELIRLLDEGDPRGARLLTLDGAYDYLFRSLRDRQGPLPRRQAGDGSGGLVLAANPAASPPATAPGTEPPEEPGTPGPCPYPGLEPFTVDDAGFYHGRERLLAELLDACTRATASPASPLIVVGPSGSGKTSLLHAGLLPALRRGATEELPGTAHAPAILLTPGESPLHTLAVRISPDRPLSRGDLTEQPETIARLIAETRAEDTGHIGPLLIVDQLEELFTACQSAREREAFVRALRAASEAGALVVLALRSDFYPHAQALPDLAAVLRDHQVLAGPLSREELRAAIERPAAEAGLALEDGLADLLLTELGAVDQSRGPTGVLPLLSHALWATWRRRSGGRLTFAGYRASGGIGSAIAQTAEEAYEELDAVGRAAARLLLTRLVRIDSETADTGRPADRQALLDGLPDPAAGAEALRRLVDARLVTVDNQTVRISHDALLRAWPLLREWIDADREWLRARRPIATDADEWWASGREPSLLYRGVRLAAARKSAERAGLTTITGQPGADPAPDPDPRLTTFLRHSWRHERRRRRTRTALLCFLVVLALLVGAAGVTAVVYQREAVAEREAAEAHRAEAVARLVAADAARLRDSRPGLSRQLGLIAYQLDPEVGFGPLLAAHETPGTYHQAAVVADLDVSADGSMLAMNADGDVVLWNTAGTGELARLPGTGPGPVALSEDGRLLAAVAPTEREALAGELTMAGTVQLWDTTDPASPRLLPTPAASPTLVTSLAFVPGRDLLALGDTEGTLTFWHLADGTDRAPLTLHGHDGTVDSLAASPSGALLASSSADGTVRLWDLEYPAESARPATTLPGEYPEESARLVTTLPGAEITEETHQDPVETVLRRVAFHPDESMLVTPRAVSEDSQHGALRLWRITDPQQPEPIELAERIMRDCSTELVSVAFGASGRTLATSCIGIGPEVVLWATDTTRPYARRSLLQPARAAGPVRFLPGTQRLLHATANGVTTSLADDAPREGAASTLGERPGGFFISTDFADGPRQLLAYQGSTHGALWELTEPGDRRLLSSLPGSGSIGAAALAFSPSGAILALGEVENDQPIVRLRDTGAPDTPELATVSGTGLVTDVAFSRDGHLLAVAAYDGDENGQIRLLDVSDPRHPAQLAAMPARAFSVAFSPRDDLLVATTEMDTLLVWETSDPRAPKLLAEQRLTWGSAIAQAVFSPDGLLLAVADFSGRLRLWRVAGGRLAGEPTLLYEEGGSHEIAFAPDSRSLAWANTGERHLQLWDLSAPATPQWRTSFGNYGTGGPDSVAFSPHSLGTLMVAGESIELWVTDPDWIIPSLCTGVGDTITPAEWEAHVPGMPYAPPCPPPDRPASVNAQTYVPR